MTHLLLAVIIIASGLAATSFVIMTLLNIFLEKKVKQNK